MVDRYFKGLASCWVKASQRVLVETARNFFGSYVTKDRLTTVQYPEERVPQIEATRDFPFLVYDGGGLAVRDALCRVPDLRKRMSAQMHLHRKKSKDKKPGRFG